jgi:hypothetical protein
MRDFRDAKAMAQTLRETLTAKSVTISHSESLELVSKMLGVSDWNTLSALLQRPETEAPAPSQPVAAASYPVAISPHLALTLSDKQNLLATIDPVARLERVAAHMEK